MLNFLRARKGPGYPPIGERKYDQRFQTMNETRGTASKASVGED